ncbi:hypothetical protein K438DRAFT_1072166 [Mycena galopus ATCC 62051]|nr:hypothetical protein K438DRAFT_1072166 [Mycena galopus ATCC 62051]
MCCSCAAASPLFPLTFGHHGFEAAEVSLSFLLSSPTLPHDLKCHFCPHSGRARNHRNPLSNSLRVRLSSPRPRRPFVRDLSAPPLPSAPTHFRLRHRARTRRGRMSLPRRHGGHRIRCGAEWQDERTVKYLGLCMLVSTYTLCFLHYYYYYYSAGSRSTSGALDSLRTRYRRPLFPPRLSPLSSSCPSFLSLIFDSLTDSLPQAPPGRRRGATEVHDSGRASTCEMGNGCVHFTGGRTRILRRAQRCGVCARYACDVSVCAMRRIGGTGSAVSLSHRGGETLREMRHREDEEEDTGDHREGGNE